MHLIFFLIAIQYSFSEMGTGILTLFYAGVMWTGKMIFGPGIFLGIAGGAWLLIIVSIACYLFFLMKKDYYTAIVVPGMWVFLHVYHKSWLAVGGRGSPDMDVEFRKSFFVVAMILLWGFILAGGYIIYQMYLGSKKSRWTRASWELAHSSKRPPSDTGPNNKDGNGEA